MGETNALERSSAAIEAHGALLVYPIDNRRDPPSLWYTLHPRTPMRWAWDDGADVRVVRLWQLREQLARGRQVVYTKWYRGRATFFSRALFAAMLAKSLARTCALPHALSADARELLALLEEDSPRSTKQLRRAAGLTGKPNERTYTRALRELWERLLIVGTGEVDDGAFPSLAIGATRWIFEELWEGAQGGANEAQQELLARALPASTLFGKHFLRLLKP
jgi:hypothetical protein